VGEANILPSEVDKQSAEFKVCTYKHSVINVRTSSDV